MTYNVFRGTLNLTVSFSPKLRPISYLVPFRSYRRLLFKVGTKNGHFASLSSPWGRLVATYAVHLSHWKARSRLPIRSN